MPAYTSTQSGLWSSASTWGGAGVPSVAGDSFTVSAGHTVTYDLYNDAVLAQAAVYGTLRFSTTQTTLLTLANQWLRVWGTGRLEIGSVTAPIPLPYSATIQWTHTAGSAGIELSAAGAQLSIHGDPAAYGGNARWTTLAEPWTTGNTFEVVGEYAYPAGSELVVTRQNSSGPGGVYGFYTVVSATPAAGRTTVVVSGPPGACATHRSRAVACVTRNVTLQKTGAARTEDAPRTSPWPTAASTLAQGTVLAVAHCELVGTQGFSGRELAHTVTAVVCRSCYWVASGRFTGTDLTICCFAYALLSPERAVVDGLLAVAQDSTAGTTGMFQTPQGNTVTRLWGEGINAPIAETSRQNTLQGNLSWLRAGYLAQADNAADLTIWGPCTGAAITAGAKDGALTGSLGWTPCGVASAPATHLAVSGVGGSWVGSTLRLRNFREPSGGLVFPSRFNWGLSNRILVEDRNRVVGASLGYYPGGDVTRSHARLRPGGTASAIRAQPSSYCTNWARVPLWEWTEHEAPIGARTRYWYVYAEGWGRTLLATELWAETEYRTAEGTLATVRSTQSVGPDAWVELSLSFTLGAVSPVRHRGWLTAYVANALVDVDAELYQVPA